MEFTMDFDEEITESLHQFITGADRYILAGLTVMIWGTAYAIVSLTTGYHLTALWIGLVLAILGMWALISILIDYIEHRLDISSTKFKKYYRSLFVTLLCALILLSLYKIIPFYIILGPLDFITTYLFYVLIIPIITMEIFDIITTKKFEYFQELKLDAHGGHKFEYVLLTMLTSLIYSGMVVLYAASTRSLDIILALLPVPILAIALYVLIFKMKIRRKENTAPNFQISIKLLLHIGVILVLSLFLYRAWLLYNHEGHSEIIEVVASSALVITGVSYSARRLRKLEFTTPGTVSKYLYGLASLGIGGNVIAILFTQATGIGDFTVDTAMMLLYIAHVIGFSIALVVSIFKLSKL
jgi:hypothetical protein